MLIRITDFEVQSGVLENPIQCPGLQGSEINTSHILSTGKLRNERELDFINADMFSSCLLFCSTQYPNQIQPIRRRVCSLAS